MAEPTVGKGGTYYVPFPVLGLASNGEIFMLSGGGGASSYKEVPNVVHAMKYVTETGKLSTVAALNTDKQLVHSLSYSPTVDLWLASSRTGCKVLQLNTDANTITEICEWSSEELGKEPEQNVAKYSPDGTLIATGGSDGKLKLWNVAEDPTSAPTLQRQCGGVVKEIFDLDFSSDGKYLAACDQTGDCRVFEVANEEIDSGTKITYSSPMIKGRAFIKLVRFLPTAEGKTTLVLGANGARGPAVVGLFNVDGTKLKEVKVDNEPIKSMALEEPFNDRLLIGLMSGAKAVYTARGLSKITKTKELHSLPAQGVVFLGESGVAVSGSGDRDIHLLKVTKDGSMLFYVFLVLLFLAAVWIAAMQLGVKGVSIGGLEL